MNQRLLHALTATLLALAACGGGGDSTSQPQSQPQGVGPAGGIVTGPGGAQVVVPASALAQSVDIQIAATSAGAPALPTGYAAFGTAYEFTPHGTSFAAPATVTLPFDPAQLPTGGVVQLLKTNAAQTAWEVVVGASVSGNRISAPVSSFSWLVPAFAAPTPVNVRSRATRIATGSGFSVARRGDGTIWLWGTLNAGITGTTTACVNSNSLDAPCRIVGPSSIDAVAAGGTFVLALTRGGEVIEFGYLPGEATIVNADVAQPKPGLTGVRQIAAGDQHALALLADGTVMAWGASGLLGDGTGIGGATPRAVVTAPNSPLSGVVAIAAAGNRSIALTAAGNVYTWGEDPAGLGLNPSPTAPYQVLSATRLTTLSSISGIAAGAYSSVFGNASGTTWYAGNRLRVTDPAQVVTPTVDAALANAAAAAAGLSTLTASSTSPWAIVVDAAGKPHGAGTPSAVANVNTLSQIVEIAGGNSSHALFVDDAGDVWAWGQNSFGQIGDGTRIDRLTPVQVPGINLN